MTATVAAAPPPLASPVCHQPCCRPWQAVTPHPPPRPDTQKQKPSPSISPGPCNPHVYQPRAYFAAAACPPPACVLVCVADAGVLQALEDGKSDEEVMKLIEGGAVATPLERRGESCCLFWGQRLFVWGQGNGDVGRFLFLGFYEEV